MTDAAPSLSEQLEKLKRKHRRDRRESQGRGLMQGILSMLQPGDLVIDCGANLGDIAAPLADTGATVHAFEPDPYNFAKLQDRLGDRANVTLHNSAVGIANGSIRLLRAANWQDNPDLASVKSTVITGGRNIAEGEGIDVPLIDFPAFLREMIAAHGQIAFLKMDIEGAELDLLEAMEQQGLFAPIRLTVAETHERKFKDLRPRFEALRSRITAAFPITKVNLDWI